MCRVKRGRIRRVRIRSTPLRRVISRARAPVHPAIPHAGAASRSHDRMAAIAVRVQSISGGCVLPLIIDAVSHKQ